MTSAFVAGATGYVGREVVRVLREQKIETIAHVRPDSASRERFATEFDALGARVDTTAWEAEAMTSSLADLAPTHVFSLLGTTRSRAKSESIEGDAYAEVDYGLTALLYEAAAALAPSPRLIYLSAVGVSEGARTAYMRARERAEKLIRGGKLPFVIARPAIITGPDRDEARVGERVAGKVLDGALAVLGVFGGRGVRDKYRSTTGAELAVALVRLGVGGGEAVIAEGADLRIEDKALESEGN